MGNSVGEILKAPSGQRKEVLDNFKQNFEKQEHAWVQCQLALENQVSEWPNTQKEGLMEVLDGFAQQNSFDSRYVELAEHKIDQYLVEHEKVVDFRNRFEDDIALIKSLTGAKVLPENKDNIDVYIGPMALEILVEPWVMGNIQKAMGIEVDRNVGGFAKTGKGGIQFIIIDKSHLSEEWGVEIVDHEREHHKSNLVEDKTTVEDHINIKAINRLNGGLIGKFRHEILEKVLKVPRRLDDELYFKYLKSDKQDDKNLFFEEYLRQIRSDSLKEMRKEIISTIKGGRNLDADEISRLFTRFDGSDYDYLKPYRDFCELPQNKGNERIVNKILVEEYSERIFSAVDSFYHLISDGGYSKDEAIVRLRNHPLRLWPKIVKRVIDQKRHPEETGDKKIDEDRYNEFEALSKKTIRFE